MSIILGIDPGTTTVGFAIVRTGTGRPVLEDWGALRTAPNTDLADKLSEIWADMQALIEKWKPDAAGMERLYFVKNVTNGIQVAHARGVCLLALREAKIPVAEFTPTQVKKGVSGSGRADKKQVQAALRFIFQMATAPTPDDAADASAVAYLAALGMPAGKRKTICTSSRFA